VIPEETLLASPVGALLAARQYGATVSAGTDGKLHVRGGGALPDDVKGALRDHAARLFEILGADSRDPMDPAVDAGITETGTVALRAHSGACLAPECNRLLSNAEFNAAGGPVCWTCQPDRRPPDYQQHLVEQRERARASHQRGAGHPSVEPTDEAEDEPT
jgi:hypothetical protein